MNNSDNTNRQDMHTKRSRLLKIRMTATMLCAAVLLCACSNEIGKDDNGSDGAEAGFTTVTLSVVTAVGEQPLSTKGLTDEQENSIHTLYILAFQPDQAGTFHLKYYATGQPESGGNGRFSFTLRRSVSGAADTKLLLIANQNPYPLVNTGMTYGEVQSALASVELTTAPAFADTGIPMFGFAGDSPDTLLEITDNMQLSANLLRAVARVDVGVGTYNEQTGVWNKGSVGFDLTHVYVFKPQNKYTLLPILSNLEYNAGGTPSVTAASPPEGGELSTGNFEYKDAAIINYTYCKAEIYIPEVALLGGQVFDANHENRTALVVGGIYNGKTNYYRIDFTTAQTNVEEEYLHDVLRNHIYRYSITSVTLPGYETPEGAYGGKAVGLSFTPTIVDWTQEKTTSPSPDMLVRMNFGGINGTIVQGTVGTVKEKGSFITDLGRVMPPLDYNNLKGEVSDNTYNGSTNGGLYKNVEDALKREGPYAKLVIAPDNARENVKWRSVPKPNRVLDAKKACWDYRGQGRSDWRLPRLSELYLLWLNRVSINQSKGFTSLGESSVTYWSATEGGTSDQAYAVTAAGQISLNAKTKTFSIRCVREVK